MLFRSLVAASALSLSASAFLVVPEVHHHPFEGHRELPPTHALELEDARSETFKLQCDACPFPEAVSEGVVSWSEDTKSSFEFTLYAKEGSLYVNDARIFPVNLDSVETVKAVQRRESDGQETEPLKLGFALMAMPLAPPEEDMELLQIRFSPLDIDGHPVPLDTVSVTAIHTTGGDLFILRTEVELPAGEDDHASWKKCNGEIRCLRQLVFDRIRALVQSAQAHMMNLKSKLGLGKGCHGKPPHPPHHKPGHQGPEFGEMEEGMHKGHHGPQSGEMEEGKPPGHGHHWHGQRPHPHHHHMHGVRRTLFRIVRFVLVPAVLGILAGLTASAIGMFVGQAIVFLWMRFRRGTTPRSTSALEQGTMSEKAVLMMEEEVANHELPPYTDEETEAAPQDTK